jgi:hypothetical protein
MRVPLNVWQLLPLLSKINKDIDFRNVAGLRLRSVTRDGFLLLLIAGIEMRTVPVAPWAHDGMNGAFCHLKGRDDFYRSSLSSCRRAENPRHCGISAKV